MSREIEKEFCKILEKAESVIDDSYIYEVIKENFYWYVKKAQLYMVFYRAVAILHIISLSFIPVIAIWQESEPVYVTIMSGVTAVLYGLLSLFNPREKWKRYRNTAELIKYEVSMFYSGYLKEEENNSIKILLIENISKIVKNENDKWVIEDKLKSKKGV